MLSLSSSKQLIKKNGESFFYLADTVWSAFTNIELSDWEYYLKVRKEQGFNVLQINILPQWDRSVEGDIEEPFEEKDGYYNLDNVNLKYFKNAKKMIEMAVEHGFTPSLVLLWCNYVPETWGAKIANTPLFHKTDIRQYTEMMINYFDCYDPIYMISGDTDFPTNQVTEYYLESLETAMDKSPNSLKVLHICGRLGEIPKKLKNHSGLDLYFYQSGHSPEHQDTSYKLADHFSRMEPTKPVINSEPCYELMGYSRKRYGRFSREDVRKAAWQSVLSGASAGITYGAHGIWSWHDVNSRFGSFIGEGFVSPYNWRQALHFPGANDYVYLKNFIVANKLTNLKPVDLVINKTTEIRTAETEEVLIVYVPSNEAIFLKGHFNSKCDYAIDLDNKTEVILTKKILEDSTMIEMTPFVRDSVYVLYK